MIDLNNLVDNLAKIKSKDTKSYNVIETVNKLKQERAFHTQKYLDLKLTID